MDYGDELGWARLELEILASLRTLGPMTARNEASYAELARRERHLRGVVETPSPSAPPAIEELDERAAIDGLTRSGIDELRSVRLELDRLTDARLLRAWSHWDRTRFQRLARREVALLAAAARHAPGDVAVGAH
jgi:hypothetical protein